jgi:hypothetical protein
MDIHGKSVLVIGGWGLVGSAICRKLMEEQPKRMIVTSLRRSEAEEAADMLRAEFPHVHEDFFVPWWGNIFVREELKDKPRGEILGKVRNRRMMIEDIVDELSPAVLRRSSIHRLMMKYRPEIVVDCVNSATGIAYQDIFQVSREVIQEIRDARKRARTRQRESLLEATEKLLCTLYIPQLIRHVQIMYRAMTDAGTKIYVKIGTSGTGGMGLNIPYTHSEERPSRVLLSKSAVAGAHTLLLFLMGRTPDAPITKEIKPTAAIAWKRVGYGEIKKQGQPIPLVDCPPSKPVKLRKTFRIRQDDAAERTGDVLRSVFIDTGENGFFSRGEFEAISTPGQMEFVTPEEIAENAVFEIKAGNTGHDIINALDNATLAPTYRAGFMFTGAMNMMKQLEHRHGVDSVAFEMLGPPRLSKLLYESYLLKMCFGDIRSAAVATPRVLSQRLVDLIQDDEALRSRIISIGIPILLPDGVSLLRGETVKIPPFRGEPEVPVTQESITQWAHDGWVDLRESNMRVWKRRLNDIIAMVDDLSTDETSSRTMHSKDYWENLTAIDPGKICGWIFTYEEKGKRMKA